MLIDYQNIHLTAHDLFAPRGTRVRESLVHPLAFAERVIEARAARQQIPAQRVTRLDAVKVFRGTPSNQREPGLYSAAQRQSAMWSRDPRVNVTYRTLRYPGDWGQAWCSERPREKGIDVLIALELVDQARAGTHHIVILASHDTDMEPAIERAFRERQVRIETAGWQGARRLKPHGRNVWHTALNATDFVNTRDRRDYWS
ncbi:MAG: NYN domain-containing protein [Nocardiopsaceae bacterium]|nr:NYN domain-containing protein [Nocardiopsaceae bacterium]